MCGMGLGCSPQAAVRSPAASPLPKAAWSHSSACAGGAGGGHLGAAVWREVPSPLPHGPPRVGKGAGLLALLEIAPSQQRARSGSLGGCLCVGRGERMSQAGREPTTSVPADVQSWTQAGISPGSAGKGNYPSERVVQKGNNQFILEARRGQLCPRLGSSPLCLCSPGWCHSALPAWGQQELPFVMQKATRYVT